VLFGGWAVAVALCALAPRAAKAERVPFGPAGAVVDPWASRDGSERIAAPFSFVHPDTVDPWRSVAASKRWIAVRSGLDLVPAWVGVRSGLDLAQRQSPTLNSWVHSEIVDPWALSNTAAFPDH